MRYAVLIEKDSDSDYGASVPDVPGCVAVGETVEEALALLRDALADHLALLAERGEEVPQPTSQVAYMDVPAPAAVG